MVDQAFDEAVAAEGDELITIAEAERRYFDQGINRLRLQNWLRRGHLTALGRIPGTSASGVIVFSEKQLLSVMQNPPQSGAAGHKSRDYATHS